MTVVTRFAPSPTGYLHVGGARTALFSWLHARKSGGQFILRIEDTDRERSTDASVQVILDGMRWLGLDYDVGPVYQTERFDRYREIIQKLLDKGDAYHCYCSKETLDAMRAEQMANKQKPKYDRRCLGLTSAPKDTPPVVRFKNPDGGSVSFKDLVRGDISVANQELDDLIIARSDGTPTYNLTVVVDDMDMGVTQVIRGDDHINNTPRQINILQALGADMPQYAHVPMILGNDGKRLSKRHGAVSVLQYRDDGFLPQALLNYLVRLGWSHGDQELFSREQMVELFEISQVNNTASVFNTEKLLWLNQHYIKNSSAEDLLPHLLPHLEELGLDTSKGADIIRVIEAHQERSKTLKDMAKEMGFFYRNIDNYDEKAANKNLRPAAMVLLQGFHDRLQKLAPWNAAAIHEQMELLIADHEVGFGALGLPVRVAVTGGTSSPSIDLTLELLGREICLQRLTLAIEWISRRNPDSP